MSARVVLLLTTALLAGCSSTPTVMRYSFAPGEEARRLMWPSGEEIPRYVYAGTLTGEENFRRVDGERDGGITRALRWLVGLDADTRRADVLQRPGAVVSDEQGRVFVADLSRQAVFVFDAPAGRLHIWEQADGVLRFVAPAGLALDADGGLLVADAELARVLRLDATGRPRGALGDGLLKRPTAVVRDAASGRVFVADAHAHDIKVFDAKGAHVATLGRRGEGAGEFNYPTHLALAGERLLVTDALNNRVQSLSLDGRPLASVGARGLYVGNLVRPKGVAGDGEGNVYVIESLYDTLLVFSPDGEFLLPIGGTGSSTGRFYLPAGVWVDARNRVYVADMFNGRVVVFQFLGGGDGR